MTARPPQTSAESNAPRADEPAEAPDASRRGVVLAGAAAALSALGGCATPPPLSAAAQPVPPGSPAPRGLLDGRVVMVTGAARGIGRAICLACAREGASVAGIDIAGPVSPVVPYPPASMADLEKTGRLVAAQQSGRRFLPTVADVRDAEAMRRAAAQAVGSLGQIDVLVANAGIMSPVKFVDMTDRHWADVVDVNLAGVANSMRAVLPHMRERKHGRMIAISSIEGRQGTSFAPQYNASKWGVIGLVKSAAIELGVDGITVNAVCPTAVNTVLFRNDAQYSAMAPDGTPKPPPESVVAKVSTMAHPLRVPFIEPEDVAAAVLFLASDEARYVSGAALDVTAGHGARYTA